MLDIGFNLFIGYSHEDETCVEHFHKHTNTLKKDGIIKDWYDRKILGGDDYQDKIDNNLEDADIICLFISADFLSSEACLKEKEEALKLRIEKGVRVIPIIISPCAWLEYPKLKKLQAFPADGKPVSSFNDIDEGWYNVFKLLKELCNEMQKIRSLTIEDSFKKFLQSAEILTNSHSQKEELQLDDIFVYPLLNKYDEVGDVEKYESNLFENEILKFGKILIAGDNQSGKTSLCKSVFKILRKLDFVPIYLRDKYKFTGNPHRKLEKAFGKQYQDTSINEIDESRIVPIIDDFHFAKHPEKYVEGYKKYDHQIFIVDDIFDLNIRNESLIKNYDRFSIIEFSPSLRDKLLNKWISIYESDLLDINPNHRYKSLDSKTEKLESSLGKMFGEGVMPAYPFFILSILAANEIQKPLDQEITSQGHCYQALIYLYLRKKGVGNEEIDIYVNFLTELASFIYQNDGQDISEDDFTKFIEDYITKFNFPLKRNDVLKTLSDVNISAYDSFGNYNFCYSYLYYFFVAKYISENLENNKDVVDRIINNLHKDENAYITVFISHHSKSQYLLDEIWLNAQVLFEKYKPATLTASELSFFDKHEEKIVNAILPSHSESPKESRKKILEEKDRIEEEKKNKSKNESKDLEELEIVQDLRRAVKTVEVMGLLIKNRSGSLKLKRLEEIYEAGLKVYLRILDSFFEIIKDEEFEDEFIAFVNEKISQILEDDDKELTIPEIKKIARTIFWNLNFGVVFGCISKSIHSLGSNNLVEVSETVSSKLNTPASFIVYQGIKMWYAKKLNINEISGRINGVNFSKTAKKLMLHKIAEHSRLHNINYKDLTKIEQRFHLSRKTLIANKAKENK
jgi:hypothetical protein